MENLDLQEIRKKLDGIDNQLVELFEKRMEQARPCMTRQGRRKN